ncbi:DUF1223 domain-containing protein [Leucothrix arctica]|uniref:DUF1223 domain-containing protein n=1 Tax=Leucothrix arctica TaxID=1481894 RepID=A0A317CHH5_9GAMM|nr:DUF1223 domain-containing protein [Leucothrix arctica]PWQ97581.1 DUF1223 domain-containing protein [Leucothrix arctica]
MPLPTKLLKQTALITLLGSTALFNIASAKDFSSQSEATDVLELYTSEGCSSCPPADRWLSTFKDKPELFKDVIPMAFHVDYWDYIGWKDRFAKPAYSIRQRDYVSSGSVSQSYTPQFVANSGEWRAWLSGKRAWKQNTNNVGVLKASITDNSDTVSVKFTPESKSLMAQAKSGSYVLNVAILGMDLSSKVRAGENRGEILKHDFVVLNHKKHTVSASPNQWQVAMPAIPQSGQKQSAVVVWLSQGANQQVIQATGGYL